MIMIVTMVTIFVVAFAAIINVVIWPSFHNEHRDTLASVGLLNILAIVMMAICLGVWWG